MLTGEMKADRSQTEARRSDGGRGAWGRLVAAKRCPRAAMLPVRTSDRPAERRAYARFLRLAGAVFVARFFGTSPAMLRALSLQKNRTPQLAKQIANLILWAVLAGLLYGVWALSKGDPLWCLGALLAIIPAGYLYEWIWKRANRSKRRAD
jgi:hypothetical protein